MKKIIINKTIILFLGVKDLITFKRNDLKLIKNEYLETFDNVIIYNYYDVKHNKEIIRDRINKLKFLNQEKIFARNCTIKIIDGSEKNLFLNMYHIQKTDKSQISYGAYYQNILVGVMCFDTVRGMNGGVLTNNYDLSRFAIKGGCIIVGLFNKILKRFINDYNPNKIISFADLNYVNRDNNIYVNNGFKLSKNIQPDYKIYLNNHNKLYHKFTYGTKYFKSSNISNEVKEQTKNDMKFVWNCGKLKYELFVNDDGIIVFGFIYMIRNKINDKKYIGQTTRNLNKRMYEYKAACKYNTFNNNYLGNSFKKYGWDNFEFTIIDTAQTIEELNSKEIKNIIKYNTTEKKSGYNIESGGCNAIPTIETIEKMSRSHSGIKQTDCWVSKRIAKAGTAEAKKYGRVRTDEEKQELSLNSPKYWQGKSRDTETKKKISETKKANGVSEKTKESNNKTVYKKQLDGIIVHTYESTAEASVFEKVNQSTVSRWCSKDKIMKNYLWTYNEN